MAEAARSASYYLKLTETVMTERDFKRLSEFIYSVCGIKLVPAKKTMLEGRLRKRLRALHLNSFDDYYNYLLSPNGLSGEIVHMTDVVTTNKTDFFREPGHFDFMTKEALPELVDAKGTGLPYRVWSAGCSTGEEPYTIAMVLSEYALDCSGFRFSILATDISTRVLDTAMSAVYEHSKVEPVPMEMRKRYLLKSKDKTRRLVRIAPELRSLVTFRRLNFMDSDFGIRGLLDIIFCRNVLIYFDRPTQERVLRQFCDHLSPGGYLFTGHSETLQNMKLPVEQMAATVYRRL
ncbi:MAG: protein-glutamate O-methyltransferase CheR [Desulfobacteraceae bacterium]|nr:protein-glutamate O-methyltransferase CheR [Desulfobacteraceae bacterium]